MSILFKKVIQCYDLRDVAEEVGLVLDPRNKDWSRTKCVFHNDNNPSLDISKTFFRCWSCGAQGNVIDFISRIYNIKKYDAVKKLANKKNITRNTNIKIPEYKIIHYDNLYDMADEDINNTKLIFECINKHTVPAYEHVESEEYLIARGIDESTVKRFNIRWIYSSKKLFNELRNEFTGDLLMKMHLMNKKGNFSLHYHKLLFPYIVDSDIIFLQGRCIDKNNTFPLKYMNIGAKVPIPYNWNSLNPKSPNIMLTEGAMDTISLSLVYNNVPCLGVPGIFHMKDKWMDILKDFNIIVAFDGDKGGDRGYFYIKNKFKKYNNTVLRLVLPHIYNDYNDYYTRKGRGIQIKEM